MLPFGVEPGEVTEAPAASDIKHVDVLLPSDFFTATRVCLLTAQKPEPTLPMCSASAISVE